MSNEANNGGETMNQSEFWSMDHVKAAQDVQKKQFIRINSASQCISRYLETPTTGSKSMTKTFPTIYKKTSTGAIQQWTIKVEGNKIITEHGQMGGALQTTEDIIREGKNIGRANETTPEEQTIKEAESKHTNKLKKDYVRTLAEAQAGGSSELIEGGILPMLAHRYDNHAAKIKWPAFAQPKLDGHRCIAIVEYDTCTLWTRTRKPIKSMPHIIAEIEQLCRRTGLRNAILDGELYNHAFKDNFEHITHLIKRDEPDPECGDVQYHIYDCPNEDGFRLRYTFIRDMLSQLSCSHLKLVETIEVADEDELMLAFEKFLDQGYEGAIVRNAEGAYMNTRSYDLQKVKTFQDGEYPIVDVKEGRGKLMGHAIFVCETEDGTRFEAKMKGETADLKQYWDDPSLAIGRLLTVQYQGLTNKSKVPRFPVGLRLRVDL